jgi:PKD repeat protein
MNTHYRTVGIIALLCIFISCYKEKVLPVAAGFTIEVVDNDYSAPVRVRIRNSTSGAQSYKWTFEGALPASSDKTDPGILTYGEPGSFKILLEAANGSGGFDTSEMTIDLVSEVQADFVAVNTQSDYAPVTFNIRNNTIGADSYEWGFEGGVPAVSAEQQPGTVVFAEPGVHTIKLIARNAKETKEKLVSVTVLPALQTDFDITWPAGNHDFQVPFKVIIENKTVSATQYQWECPGGVFSDISTAAEPEILYTSPGTYTLTLTARNDKGQQTISKTITLLPNTNLYSFSNVRLGINTAHNTIGCYFSASLGRVLTTSEVDAITGAEIDFVYFGLNNSFAVNKIVSPADAGNYTFPAIPNAGNTVVINRQEEITAGELLLPAAFESITSGTALQSIPVNYTDATYEHFNNARVPRVVLFKTADGRKGALRINSYVENGLQSYMLCDIKVIKDY